LLQDIRRVLRPSGREMHKVAISAGIGADAAAGVALALAGAARIHTVAAAYLNDLAAAAIRLAE
jgi:hypothetical protein